MESFSFSLCFTFLGDFGTKNLYGILSYSDILCENYVNFYRWFHSCIWWFVANWNHNLPFLLSTTQLSWFFKRGRALLNIIVSRCHYYYKVKVGKFQGDFRKGKKFQLLFCNWGLSIEVWWCYNYSILFIIFC